MEVDNWGQDLEHILALGPSLFSPLPGCHGMRVSFVMTSLHAISALELTDHGLNPLETARGINLSFFVLQVPDILS